MGDTGLYLPSKHWLSSDVDEMMARHLAAFENCPDRRNKRIHMGSQDKWYLPLVPFFCIQVKAGCSS